jgi:prepilin-type processing-associated H-X9-DG protein
MKSNALTLVELLVVVGIVALLFAMLLPSLSGARQSAQSTQCLSNLRQMAIAAQTYAIHHDGRLPIAYYYANDGTRSYTHAWDLTTIEENGAIIDVIPGVLWLGQGPGQIQQCPSFEGGANWLADPYTGYNYNTSYIGHGQFESIPAPVKVSQIRIPSRVAMFGDGQYLAGGNKFMRAPFPNPGDESFTGRWAGTQGFRHRTQTNVAFVDGHTQSLPDRFTINADGAENIAPGTGFLSRDNRMYGGH